MDDSISIASSDSSKARAAGRTASARAKLNKLQELEEIEIEELRLRYRKLRIQQEIKLEEAAAEETAMTSLITRSETGFDYEVHLNDGNILDRPINESIPDPLLPDSRAEQTHDFNTQSAPIADSTPNISQYQTSNINTGVNRNPFSNFTYHAPTQDFETYMPPIIPPINANPQLPTIFVPQPPPRAIPEPQIASVHQEGTQSHNDELGLTFKQLVDSIRLPPIKVEIFHGDPIKFPTWLAAFNSLVEAKTCSNYERLSLLAQHLGGEPKALIQNYLLLQTDSAYTMAKQELINRYGHPSVVAKALLSKLGSWSKVPPKDGIALRKFSDFISEVSAAKLTIPDLGVLDYAQENQKLVAKLPYYLEAKWRRIVRAHMDTSSFPSFESFSEFLKMHSKEANIPMFQTLENNSNKRAFATVRVFCKYCDNDSHSLGKCGKFGKLSNEEKVTLVRNWSLCFGCLKLGHRSKDCRCRLQCDICRGKHPTVLHQERVPVVNNPPRVADKATSAACSKDDGICTMAIIPVLVKSPRNGRAIATYAFLDPGSSISFCTENLRKSLGLGGRVAEIAIDTMGSTQNFKTRIISNLKISNLEGNNGIDLPNVYTKETLPVSRVHIPTQDDIDRWDHFRGKVVIPNIDAEVGLMLGNAIAEAYTPLDIITGPPGSPYAAKTALGWVPWNVVRQGTGVIHTVNRVEIQTINEHEKLTRLVDEARKIDFPEVSFSDKLCPSKEDIKFCKIIEEGMVHKDGHYFMPLPWKYENMQLPNNKVLAKKRFELLERRFTKDCNIREKYKESINKMMTKGYMEEVEENDDNSGVQNIWYLPHHPVLSEKKQGKLRVVFDCATKYAGVSLNDFLLQGPDVTNTLIGVLLKFRQERIAITADIEGMIMQVIVQKKDRDALRFLWRPSPTLPLKTYRMTRHLFGASSSPACANLALKRTLEDHGVKYDETTREILDNNFYVDDCLASVEGKERAKKVIKELSSLCNEGGFHLTKWMSNDKDVLASINVEERAPEVMSLNLNDDHLPTIRALGVQWAPETDVLKFDIRVPERNPTTKRGMLSVVSSIFDPLGLVSPFVLTAKMILQETCRLNLGWDEPVTGILLQRWNAWLHELRLLSDWCISRCYKFGLSSNVVSSELHVFCDASEKGYGICAFLRQRDDQDNVVLSLVLARSRVAPLKYMSIPRLELTAAVMAARLTDTILSDLNVCRVYFWTDSQTVLKYINSDSRRFKAFVANRIAVILDLTDKSQWRYVRSENNPADETSRGQDVGKFLNNVRWIKGPTFLQNINEEWKDQDGQIIQENDNDPELRNTSSAVLEEVPCCFLDDLIKRCSTFKKLRNVVGRVLAFIRKLKQKRASHQAIGTTTVVENLNNLDEAERLILIHEQQRYFGTLIRALKDGKTPTSDPLHNLDPILKDGLVRVGGRLRRSNLLEDAKYPVIVPKLSRVARFIAEDAHRSVGHLGKAAILAHIWQKYWLVGGGALIKRVVHGCVICRKYRSRPVNQKMASLPKERVLGENPPFYNTGLDMFGPFTIKRGRCTVKRYGLLFTCMATRAIHLEAVYSADADSCLNAIRRFVCRRRNVLEQIMVPTL